MDDEVLDYPVGNILLEVQEVLEQFQWVLLWEMVCLICLIFLIQGIPENEMLEAYIFSFDFRFVIIKSSP